MWKGTAVLTFLLDDLFVSHFTPYLLLSTLDLKCLVPYTSLAPGIVEGVIVLVLVGSPVEVLPVEVRRFETVSSG